MKPRVCLGLPFSKSYTFLTWYLDIFLKSVPLGKNCRIIRNTRVKVIIRQIGNGQKHFWSVIPAWQKCHYRETKFISNAYGNLEND